jgi:hypothetical protein
VRPDAKSASSGRVQYHNNQYVHGNIYVNFNGPIVAANPQQIQSLTMQNQRFLNQLMGDDQMPQIHSQSTLPVISTGIGSSQ